MRQTRTNQTPHVDDDVRLMAAVEHARRRNRWRDGATSWDAEQWQAYGPDPDAYLYPHEDVNDWEGNDPPD